MRPVGHVDRKPGKDETADAGSTATTAATVTLAPIIMPVGMMNMLTTECSKPWAKKIRIGIQAVAILPMMEVVPMASTTARQTIQLHSIALTNTVTMPAKPNASYPVVLASAAAIRRAATPAGAIAPMSVSA